MSNSDMDVSRAPASDSKLRSLLLAVLVLAMLGTGAELILLEHTESVWQWVPLACLGVGLVSIGAVAAAPGSGTIWVFRIVMLAFVAAGTTGLYLHYVGNMAFELEMYPSMKGFDLVKESLMGATPALAPGAMAWLGLLGLAYTYQHPRLRRS